MEEKELENLKNFKLYVFDGEVYVKATDYKKIAVENKELEKENKELKEENEKLQNKLNKLKKIYVSKHMEEEIERLISE